jgi:hypothetical protein
MPDPWGRFAGTDELAAVFRHFATRRCGSYAPLYARLAGGIASEPALLAIAARAAPGQSPPDLLLAAAHCLLAGEPEHPLARFYPTLSAETVAGDPFPVFREFCLERHDQLVQVVSSRQVQTNEVRRCAYLMPVIMLVGSLAGRPLALIEAGASAGLNLALDQYGYDYGVGTVLGSVAAPVVLRCSLRGLYRPPVGLPMPAVGWRAGIDLHPLNPADPEDASWLQALVWADHPGRAALLRNALTAAAARPTIPVHAGDATEQLPSLVATAPAELAVCLFHTAFLAHLSRLDRERFEYLVGVLSAARPIYWVQAEPRADPAEPRLRLTLCQDGRVVEEWPLGHYQPHGEWLQWTATSKPEAYQVLEPQPGV